MRRQRQPESRTRRSCCNSREGCCGSPRGPVRFRIYILRDRGLTRDLNEPARVARHRALVLTVDIPVAGRREHELHHGSRQRRSVFACYSMGAVPTVIIAIPPGLGDNPSRVN